MESFHQRRFGYALSYMAMSVRLDPYRRAFLAGEWRKTRTRLRKYGYWKAREFRPRSWRKGYVPLSELVRWG